MDLVSDRFFEHEEPFLEDFAKGKILIEGLLALDGVHDAHDDLALLLPEPPKIKSLLHFGLEVLRNLQKSQLLVQLLLLNLHLQKFLLKLLGFCLNGKVLLIHIVDAGVQAE